MEVLIGFNDAEGSFIASDPFNYTGMHLISYAELCSLAERKKDASLLEDVKEYDFWCII